MKLSRHFISFLLSALMLIGVVNVISASAKDFFDTRGKEFWLVFTPNYHSSNYYGSDSVYIYISAQCPAKGQIEACSSTGYITKSNFNINSANQTLTFSFAAEDYEIFGAAGTTDYQNQDESVAKQHFKITADTNISVYALTQANLTSDASLVLPKKALDVDYLVMTYPSDAFTENKNEDTPCQFSVLATEDNTNVVIYLSDNSFEHPAHDSLKVTLNAGESYLVQGNLNKDFSDLTGSEITANKKIAVFAGHQRATIPYSDDQHQQASRDCLYEQLTPVKVWGKSAFITPFPQFTNTGKYGTTDKFRILSCTDNTQININGASAGVFNKGQFYEGNLDNVKLVTANNPILAASFAKTSSYSSYAEEIGDPLMLINPPEEQYLNSYLIINAQSNDNSGFGMEKAFTNQYIVVTIPDTGISSLKIDNVLTGSQYFSHISNSAYSYANIPVKDGAHLVTANVKFGVSVCGFGLADSYGYLGGMCVTPLDFKVPEIYSTGSCLARNGVVTDSSDDDLGLREVVSLKDSNINCEVKIDTFALDAKLTHFSVSVNNPAEDAYYMIRATDDNGNIKYYDGMIPGNTIEISSVGDTNKSVLNFGNVMIGDVACDSIILHNYGHFQIVLNTAFTSRNKIVSIPPSQLPLMLNPGESKALYVCVAPLSADNKEYCDTLNLAYNCFGQQYTLKYKPGSFSDTVDTKCGLGLILTHAAVGRDYFESMVYPNPAASTYYIEYVAGDDAVGKITISDLSGKVIKEEIMKFYKGNNRVEKDASDIDNGYYIMKVSVNGIVIIHKLIINK